MACRPNCVCDSCWERYLTVEVPQKIAALVRAPIMELLDRSTSRSDSRKPQRHSGRSRRKVLDADVPSGGSVHVDAAVDERPPDPVEESPGSDEAPLAKDEPITEEAQEGAQEAATRPDPQKRLHLLKQRALELGIGRAPEAPAEESEGSVDSTPL